MIYKRVLKLLIHIFNNGDTSFDVLFALPMCSQWQKRHKQDQDLNV